MYTLVKITFDDINITKVKIDDKKPKDQQQFYTWSLIFELYQGISQNI